MMNTHESTAAGGGRAPCTTRGTNPVETPSSASPERRWVARRLGALAGISLMALALLTLPAPAVAQVDWTLQSPAASPSTRGYAPLAYDSVRGRTVLFGGYLPYCIWYDETWEWNGTDWVQATPSLSPPARAGHGTAYDAGRQRTVIYGGHEPHCAGANLNDMWEWDGMVWLQRFPSNNPGPRRDHSMVYDIARDRIVLFGGYGSGPLADTWLWDGNQWVQAAPAASPSARYAYGMAYDEARARVVLFGGTTGTADLSDTWEWDGTQWSQVIPAHVPGVRSSHRLSYDSHRGRVVLFGGTNAPGVSLDDTWEWDGNDWTEMAPANQPPGRSSAGMAYDPLHRETVLFGGNFGPNGTLNDTWLYGPLVECTTDADCDDGDACTLTDVCREGTCAYTEYVWSGLLQPINGEGTSIFKHGSTVPVKFRLTGPCAGRPAINARLFIAKVSDSVVGTELEATSTSAADSGNTFRYGAAEDMYIFNLATRPLSPGTWALRVDLGDGVDARTVWSNRPPFPCSLRQRPARCSACPRTGETGGSDAEEERSRAGGQATVLGGS